MKKISVFCFISCCLIVIVSACFAAEDLKKIDIFEDKNNKKAILQVYLKCVDNQYKFVAQLVNADKRATDSFCFEINDNLYKELGLAQKITYRGFFAGKCDFVLEDRAGVSKYFVEKIKLIGAPKEFIAGPCYLIDYRDDAFWIRKSSCSSETGFPICIPESMSKINDLIEKEYVFRIRDGNVCYPVEGHTICGTIESFKLSRRDSEIEKSIVQIEVNLQKEKKHLPVHYKNRFKKRLFYGFLLSCCLLYCFKDRVLDMWK